MVTLSKNGKHKGVAIHILVAKSFVDNPENKPEVNHVDGNKENNHESNLEWNTRLENQQHSVYMCGVNDKDHAANIIKEKIWKPLKIA